MRALALVLLVATPAFAQLKNLQVLPKSTTKDEIKQIMRAQSKALDVECDHCHAVPDMASDENPLKQVAREMMKMQDDVNKKWLKDKKTKVSCATCHRGQKTPKL